MFEMENVGKEFRLLLLPESDSNISQYTCAVKSYGATYIRNCLPYIKSMKS